jgi:hypothetical protein
MDKICHFPEDAIRVFSVRCMSALGNSQYINPSTCLLLDRLGLFPGTIYSNSQNLWPPGDLGNGLAHRFHNPRLLNLIRISALQFSELLRALPWTWPGSDKNQHTGRISDGK